VVRQDLERERGAKGRQKGEPRAVRQLREEAHHAQPLAVIEGRVLEDLPALDAVGHVLDVELNAVPRTRQELQQRGLTISERVGSRIVILD
jgi:hypothetical protein